MLNRTMGNIELVLDALRRHVLKFAHVLSIVLLSTAIYGCNAKIIGEGGGGALGGGGGGSAGALQSPTSLHRPLTERIQQPTP